MIIPITFVIGLFVSVPINSFLLVIINIGIIATGKTKLRVTWLSNSAFIGLTPSKMIIIPGNMVTNLVMLSLILSPTNPCIIVCPARVPTVAEERPEAISAIPKAPADAAPRRGERD